MYNKKGEKANIIICNHSSWLDILAFMVVHETVVGFVAKRGVLGIPVIGYLSRVWNSIYVDREGEEKKGKSVVEQLKDRCDNASGNFKVFSFITHLKFEYLRADANCGLSRRNNLQWKTIE